MLESLFQQDSTRDVDLINYLHFKGVVNDKSDNEHPVNAARKGAGLIYFNLIKTMP